MDSVWISEYFATLGAREPFPRNTLDNKPLDLDGFLFQFAYLTGTQLFYFGFCSRIFSTRTYAEL